MKVSLHNIIRKDRLNSKGEAPVYLRITKGRKTAFISTGIRLEPKYWDEKREKVKTNHPNHGELNALLLSIEKEYSSRLYKVQADNLSAPVKTISKSITGTDTVDFFELASQIQIRYEREGKIGSRDKVKAIVSKVRMYSKLKKLSLVDIDVSFLKGYENYCINVRGNMQNTIHKDMKFIRQVFNVAIREGLTTLADNPFNRYKVKTAKTSRRYLTQDELHRIEQLQLSHDTIARYKDIFIFCCYAGGIRISDALMLKWENVVGEKVQFTIRKTSEQISHRIPNKAQMVLDKYRPKDTRYIFGLVRDTLDETNPLAVDRAISGATALVNKNLKIIAKLAAIDKPLSSHIARHTFATLALQMEIPLEVVQKILGHANIRETQIYAKVVDKAIDDAMNKFG